MTSCSTGPRRGPTAPANGEPGSRRSPTRARRSARCGLQIAGERSGPPRPVLLGFGGQVAPPGHGAHRRPATPRRPSPATVRRRRRPAGPCPAQKEVRVVLPGEPDTPAAPGCWSTPRAPRRAPPGRRPPPRSSLGGRVIGPDAGRVPRRGGGQLGVHQHVGAVVLDRLEGGDHPAELLALLGVVGPHGQGRAATPAASAAARTRPRRNAGRRPPVTTVTAAPPGSPGPGAGWGP